MKKILICILIIIISLTSCSNNDPLTEDMYITSNLYVWNGSNYTLVNEITGGSDIFLGENDVIRYASLTNNGTCTGIGKYGIAGEDLLFGDLVYNYNDFWYKTSSDNVSKCNKEIGICILESSDENDSTVILIDGIICSDLYDSFDSGSILYISNSSGIITDTIPSDSGETVRIIGYYNDNDLVTLKTDNTYIVLE